jgi:hypothetical protein
MSEASSDQHPFRNLIVWSVGIAVLFAIFAVITLASLGGDPIKHW